MKMKITKIIILLFLGSCSSPINIKHNSSNNELTKEDRKVILKVKGNHESSIPSSQDGNGFAYSIPDEIKDVTLMQAEEALSRKTNEKLRRSSYPVPGEEYYGIDLGNEENNKSKKR